MVYSLGKCRRFEIGQEPESSRYCAECNRLHPPEEGDLGRSKHIRQASRSALVDGEIMMSQSGLDSGMWASPGYQRVPYHISVDSWVLGTSGWQRASSGSPPADLQDLLDQIFQESSAKCPGTSLQLLIAAPGPLPLPRPSAQCSGEARRK